MPRVGGVLVAVLAALTLASACGGDEEGSEGGSGGGPVEPSGSGGASGAPTTGFGANANTGSRLPGFRIVGDRCGSDSDCLGGLDCLDPEEGTFAVGTPPSGLCTLSCSDSSECWEYNINSLCLPVSDTEAYCVETCLLGSPLAGENKCHLREEFSCQPIQAPSIGSCETDFDCFDLAIAAAGNTQPAVPYHCFAGECAIIPLCLPRCNSDFDCPPNLFCDPLYGECVDEEPTGKGIGEPCDPEAEENECRAYCVSVDTEGNGECAEPCTLGARGACGARDTSSGDASCVPLSFGWTLGALDDGLCATNCDCSDDCLGDDVCLVYPGSPLGGVCVGGVDPDEVPEDQLMNDCEPVGGGGAAGAAGMSGQ